MKPAGSLAVVVALLLGALSCDTPTGVVHGGAQLAWVSAPPATLREGDSATVTVELRDTGGQPLLSLDGAPVSLRFAFAQDSQPGTACGAACTTTVTQGRARITVGWVSAGNWTAIACVRPPAPADSACAQAPLTVLPVRARLVTYPADSIGRRVRFPVEVRLQLPDNTPVTDLPHTVRLRFTSASPVAGHARCPEAGPVCERAPVAGVVRLDSVLVLDTAATTLEACAIAPNGHERCDPAGPRAFRVVVPRLALHFVMEPGGGSAGVPFGAQPVIEALEPDGTRRTDFAGLVDLTLDVVPALQPALAGTGADGATARGTVTVRAAAGVATLADLRVNRSGIGYTLLAAATGAVADTSAAFDIPLDPAQLRMVAREGDNQSAPIGTMLPIPPAVLVTGLRDDPIAGIVVSFEVTWCSGGGSGCAEGGIASSLDTTDLTGIATSGRWTLGQSAGGYRLVATATNLAPVTFTATAGGLPTQVVFLVQPSDVVAGDTMRPSVVVELRDNQGLRGLGATDSVSLRAYECITGSPGDHCSERRGEVTDRFVGTKARAAIDGRATFGDIAVTQAGAHFLESSVSAGPTGQSVVFGVAAGAPAVLVIRAGNDQTAVAGTAVDTVPLVRLTDGYGNTSPGTGVAVTFTVMTGGGSVTGAVQTIDAYGLAQPGSWTLGPVPGLNVLTARADDIADAVSFSATGTVPLFHATSVSAGWDFTCAAAQTTNLPYCWGDNAYGQLGEGTQTARSRPTLLAGGLLQFTQVSGGFRFACGLATTGAAYCWGNNFYGQLGIDTADLVQHATPEAVAGGHTFQQISAGFGHVCALDTDGAVWCWGATSEGSLGVATATPFHPVHVASLLHFTQIDVGGNTSCALAASGDIWCWGYNGYGGVGNDSTDARLYVPVQVAGGRSYTQVSVGTFHTCGVAAGAVYCWGRNVEGQLGIGTTSPTSAPGSAVPVAALGALGVTRQVAAGNTHTCALNGTGETYCWGDNANGQLGDLTTTRRTSGVLVRTDARFVAITAGLLHTCALKEAGAAYCWGTNGSGRLGDGTLIQRTAPVPVVAP